MFKNRKSKLLYDKNIINYNDIINNVNCSGLDSFFNIKSELEHIGKFVYNIHIENLEKKLYENGKALIYYNNGLKVADNYSIEDNKIIINGSYYYEDISKPINRRCVFVLDNSLKVSKKSLIQAIISNLNDINIYLFNEIKNRQLKAFIIGDENTQNELKKVVRDFENNSTPFVTLNNGLLKNNLSFERITTDTNLNDYLNIFTFYNDLRLSFLGIESDKNDKKERLLESEEEDKNKTIEYISNDELLQRKIACMKIKKYFNIEVRVKKC